jgi:hypothetical protein
MISILNPGIPVVGSVIQTVSTPFTGTTVITGNTPAATGLTGSITPISTTNKVLVHCSFSFGSSTAAAGVFFLYRNGVLIPEATGATAGSRRRATSSGFTANAGTFMHGCITFLDSPASTSAQTYTLYAGSDTTLSVYINRSVTDTDSGGYNRCFSNILLQEIKV